MKRIVLSIVVLLVLLCGIAVAETTIVAEGECGVISSTLTWTLDSKGTLMIKGKGEMEKDYAWYTYRSFIKMVNIEFGVTTIANNAFQDCSSLSSIIVPESVTYIGDGAFSGCGSLKKVYVDSLDSWLNVSFSSGTSNPMVYDAELYIAGELTSELFLPDGLTQINNNAFYGCGSLTSIHIPESVTYIGRDAFFGCNSLVKIYAESLEGWLNISFSNWDSSPLHYAEELYIANELVTDLILPEGLSAIGKYAFSGYSKLTSVKFPVGLITIGENAFSGCTGLNNLVLPDGVTTIGNDAFSGCSSLSSICIPEGLTTIGRFAFANCTNLSSVEISDSVATIGGYAFMWCSNLTSITIPDSVFFIGREAFFGCTALRKVQLPVSSLYEDNFTSCFGDCPVSEVVIVGKGIQTNAFSGCSSLTSITISDSVTSIGGCAFRDCSNLEKIIFCGRSMPSIGNDAIPDSPTIYCHKGSEVAEWAMKNGYTIEYLEDHTHIPVTDPAVPATHVTTGLTEGSHCSVCGEVLAAQQIVPIVQVEKVVLPAELEVIEAEAFAGDSFECVVLPEGCKEIGAGAFRDCAQLRFAEIPRSVEYIDGSAFAGCSDGLIIVTTSGSVAEDFANRNGITCVLR